jgi:Carboxypeptidase regulatory-like domain/TonB dependent receptor
MRTHPYTRAARASAFLIAAAATACCLAPLWAARAQASATLSGTVADETGAVIPGAEIIITNPATGLQRRLVTDGEGSFSFPLLPPARYDVRVERAGFAPVEIRGATLGAGDHRAYRVLLKIVGVSESVQVDDQSLLQGAGAVTTVIEQRLVENLPLAGRTLQPLLELLPGSVVMRASFGEQGQFSVNGQRANANYFTVDGVSANFGVSAGTAPGQAAAGSLPALTAHGGTNSLVSADALQEMRVQSSSYAPEWGRAPGAQISLVTRAGTNEFHGTASGYFRHEKLDANDWFANSRKFHKPPMRQNLFSATLGGPLSRDRVFFFASYEGLRLRQPRVTITEVPSDAARTMSPATLRPFLDAFPRQNGPRSTPTLGQFSAAYSNPSRFDAFSLRVDANLGGRFYAFGRYSRMDSEDLQRGRGFALGTSELSLNTIGRTSVGTETLTAGAIWPVSARLSNDVRVNWSRARGATSFTLDDLGRIADSGLPKPPALAELLPFLASADSELLFRVLGGLNTNFAHGRNADNAQRQFNLVDHLTLNGGAHQLKIGADYRLLSPIYDPAGHFQRITFPSALTLGNNEDLDRGRASEVLIAAGGSPRRPLFTNFSAFAQDTWRAGERLTLTYGVRWELSPPPHEKTGNPPLNITVRADAAGPALAPAGTRLWATTYTNFAPRLGVAYQLRPGAGTVLRGGIGIYYDAGGGQAAQVFGSVPPYTSVRRLNGVLFPLDPAQLSPEGLPADTPFDTAYAFDYGLRMPYSVQWNVSVEQPVGARQVVSVAYVGAAGRRLFRQTLLPPSQIFREVRLTTNSAKSDYHSLQVRFQRRLPGRLHATYSYTWARSVDDASADSEIAASFARSELPPQRSASDFDVRHAASAALSYDLPALNFSRLSCALSRGWSLDSIFRARTAAPVNVFVGRTLLSGELIELSSPFVRPGVPLVVEDPAAPGGRRINREAFAPSASQAGTPLERNSLRGFGMWQADVSLRRRLAVTGRVKLQLRVDIFNVFNHPNFGDPVADLGSGLFGQSVQMLGPSLGSGGVNGGLSPVYQFGGPRAAQLVVRLDF